MRPPFSGSPGEGGDPSLNERPGASGLASPRSAKVPARCIFCAHVNPAGAKFCNDCGSPLHLKPCRQCDAINDRDARRCYNCGIADPVSEPLEPAPKAVATAATAGTAAANDVRIEAVPAMQQVSGVEPRETSLPDDNATMAVESDAVIATPQPPVMNGDVDFSSPEIASEGRAAERPRRSRWPMAGALSAAVVAAVAVYVYRADPSSPRPREVPHATQAPAAVTELIPAKIDVPAAVATTTEPVAAAPTAPPVATAGTGDSHAAVPSPVAKKSSTSVKTTAKKAKKTPPKKAASTPTTPASKAATTQVAKPSQ